MFARFAVSLVSLLILQGATAAPLQPYRTGDWKQIVQSGAGRPIIVHFWGVTCGPCLVELPKWGKFIRDQSTVNVVFIEVDQTPEKVARKILAEAKLDRASNRALVTPYDEYMRYEVDPKWVGELPSTVLVGADGKVTRLSGTVDFGALRTWLVRESGPAAGQK